MTTSDMPLDPDRYKLWQSVAEQYRLKKYLSKQEKREARKARQRRRRLLPLFK